MMRFRSVVIVAVLLVATVAGAQESFELVATGYRIVGCYFLPFSSGSQAIWFDPNGGLWDPTFRLLAGSGGRVFAIAQSPRRIARVLATGLGETVFTFPAGFPDIRALAVAPNGRFFVATASGLAVISPAGQLEASYPALTFGYDPILTVGADGCTLYRATLYGDPVRRINGCTGEMLSPFPVAAKWVTDLDTLSNGHVLISDEYGVTEYDAGGKFVRRIVQQNGDVAMHVAVTANESAIWLARMPICDLDGEFSKISLVNGEVLATRRFQFMNNLIGMAAGAADVPPIPAATPTTLLVLAGALALAALAVLK